MKKTILSMLLAVGTVWLSAVFTSCNKDDDEEFVKEENVYKQIIGTWENVDHTDGDYIDSDLGVVFTFNTNKTASQRVYLTMNGVIMRDYTSNYAYTFDGRKVTLYHDGDMNDSDPWIMYATIDGNKMSLGNEEDGYFDLTKKQPRNNMRSGNSRTSILKMQ